VIGGGDVVDLVTPGGDGTVVWLDGSLRDPAEAALHWSDHGITVGDGVFETLKLVDGRPFATTRHLARLRRSAEGLGLPAPPTATVEEACAAVAGAWGGRPGRLRITVTAGPGPMGSWRGGSGPTLLVVAGPMVVDRSPTAALVVPWTRNERGALAGLKTTSYAENVVALARAQEAGASEALFANTSGRLCEGTGSNVVVGRGDRLLTPPLSSGCLAGVTRALLVEAMAAHGAPVQEEDLPIDVLAEADEVLLLSTGRDVQPVERLVLADGSERHLGAPGPLGALAGRVWDDAYGPGTDPDP
jgi:branched-chain amino acid aminotransferase